jgi:hypothetical protein
MSFAFANAQSPLNMTTPVVTLNSGSQCGNPAVEQFLRNAGSEQPPLHEATQNESLTTCAVAEVYDDLVQALAACAAQFLLVRVPAAP